MLMQQTWIEMARSYVPFLISICIPELIPSISQRRICYCFIDRWSNAKLFVVGGAGDEDIKYRVGEPQLMYIPHSIELRFGDYRDRENEPHSENLKLPQ